VVKTAENVIKLMDSSYHITKEWRGITNPAKLIPNLTIGSGLVHTEDKLYFTGSPGFIQVYDLATKTVERPLLVNERNPISRIDNTYPIPLVVTSIAICDGTLATLESNGETANAISYLKFWSLEDMTLQTLVHNPHENLGARIVAGICEFASIGGDGSWVIWR
jgi:hypothetical protein